MSIPFKAKSSQVESSHVVSSRQVESSRVESYRVKSIQARSSVESSRLLIALAPSFVSKVVQGITGVASNTSISAQGEIQFVPEKQPLMALFLHITCETKKAIKTAESHIEPEAPKCSNLVVMAKEECQECLKLSF